MSHKPHGPYERYFKRLIDTLVSATSLILLSPIFGIVALSVRWKLGSPVIFAQQRPGKDERLFKLYKFRTMTDACNEDGALLSDEERLTHFGRVLRTTSLDELPELLNILRGDMSFVGPRPLLVKYLPFYKDSERARHDVRPGLTGLAQITGRNNLSWNERFEYDVEYANCITFVGDLKIIGNTITQVLRRKDIASGDELIMENLDVERAQHGN